VETTSRVSGARVRGASGWEGVSVAAALAAVAEKLRQANGGAALVASPQATNEDLFAFRTLVDHTKAHLDFRVGDPQDKLHVREDDVLLRADRNPNTQGCLDLGMGRDGVDAIVRDCASGAVKVLLLQGPELLRLPAAAAAVRKVPFVVVMATHEGPELGAASVVLPAAMWAEVEGTFTNYQRRVQRLRRAVAPPGEARARWELSAELLRLLGASFAATSAREVFALLTSAVSDYSGLDYRGLGTTGRVIAGPSAAASAGTGA
jgi:predicted molibdopterin-dependent oxidoreductase YjgC